MLLFKFGQEVHMNDLYENGNLYLNTISYFNDIEYDNSLRCDTYENKNILHNSKTTKLSLDGKLLDIKNIKGAAYIPFLDQDKYTHIYSMSLFLADTQEPFDERVREFGDTVIVIFDINEFIKRIIVALKEQNLYAKAKPVTYLDYKEHTWLIDVFNKSKEYNFQKEWRIALRKNDNKDKPYVLNIGCIKDIAKKKNIVDFKNVKKDHELVFFEDILIKYD